MIYKTIPVDNGNIIIDIEPITKHKSLFDVLRTTEIKTKIEFEFVVKLKMFNEDCEDCMVGYKCVGAILVIDTFEEKFNREKTLEMVFNACLKNGGKEIINNFKIQAEKFNSIKEYIKNMPSELKELFVKSIDSLEFQNFIK